MSTNKEYIELIDKVKNILDNHNPQAIEIAKLLRSAINTNNKQALDALSIYRESNNDIANLESTIINSFSLKEIKKHYIHISEFLYANSKDKTDKDSKYLEMLLKYDTKEFNENEQRFVFNSKKAQSKADYIKDALIASDQFHNSLTIYHDFGHAFAKVVCVDCAENSPTVLYAGLYPKDSGYIAQPEICYINNTISPLSDNNERMPSSLYKSAVSSGGHSGKKIIATSVDGYIPLLIKVFAKYLALDLKQPNAAPQQGEQVYTKPNIHANDKYTLKIEHASFMFNDKYKLEDLDSYKDYYDNIDDINHKSFKISTEDANTIIDRVMHLSNHCDSKYHYNFLKNNFIDFAQHLYEQADFSNNHFHEMYPLLYPINPMGAFRILTEIGGTVNSIISETYNILSNVEHNLWEYI